MRFYFILFFIFSVFKGFSQDPLTRIAIGIYDKDTKSPISNYKVEVVSLYLGNGTVFVSNNFLLGYTDECGYLDNVVSQSRADVGAHGQYSKGKTFGLLFTHCEYGQFIQYFEVTDESLSVEVTRPFIYDLKVFTDNSKTFIRFEWRMRLFSLRRYDSHGSMGDNSSKGTGIQKGYAGPFIYSNQNVKADSLITFTDYDVTKGNTYDYSISAYPTSISCPPGVNVSIKLNDATPDSISFLPIIKLVCPPVEPVLSLTDFKIFPIPYSDLLTIRSDHYLTEPISVSVFSILGQKLFSSEIFLSPNQEYAIDLKNLTPGFQLFQIKYKNGLITHRVIKLEP